MPLQTLISAHGPLPLTKVVTLGADGPVVFIVTGSAWSSTAPGPIGIQVSVNGTVIGSTTVFANLSSVHMTLPTLFANATITSNQPQKITITALPNSVTDLNDNFVVQLLT